MMDADIEDLVREAHGDPTPSSETDKELLEEVTRSAQVAPRRRRWEFAVVAAAAIVIAILLLTSKDPEPGLVDPSAVGDGPGEMPILASAVSEDGRFRLNLEHLELAPPAPGSLDNPTLMLQGRAVVEGPRLIAAPEVTVRRMTTPDGQDWTPEGLGFGYRGIIHGARGNFAIHHIDLGPEPTKIALLELEVTFLRLRDRDHRFEGIEPGADGKKLLPPYNLGFEAKPSEFRIGACMTDESISAAKADLSLAWPGNQTVASSARIVDASGAVLVPTGMNFSGSFVSVGYTRGLFSPAEMTIVYPVTVTMPDPEPVERMPAVFRFRDLELPPVRDRYVSDSPWGEPSNGFAIRADLPTRVEQGEPVLAVIEFARQKAGLPPGVTRLETRDAEEFLTLRLSPPDGGKVILIRPEDWALGMHEPLEPGEPEPNLDRDVPPVRTHFPLARVRKALPPGRYEGVVELSIPKTKKMRPLYEQGNERLWHGTLRSGRFTLEIVAEPARTRTLRLPTRLRLEKGLRRTLRPDDTEGVEKILRLTFRPDDTEEVKVPRRNGHYLDTTIEYEYATPLEGGPIRSDCGVPVPQDPNSILTLPADHQGPLEVKITMSLFHTTDPPAHFSPLTARVEVLWRRTFEVSYSAEEIDALR